MGCGKSTVGRRLAEVLGCTFADLDAVIEDMCSMDIKSIFASCGEEFFRKKEHEALHKLLHVTEEGNIVIALGGGTVTVPECRTEIQTAAVCIYLRAEADTIIRNLSSGTAGRPLLAGCKDKAELEERIEKMLNERQGIYKNAAHIIIDTDGKSPDELANEIACRTAEFIR